MTSGSDPLIRLGGRDTVAVARSDIAADQSLGDGLLANQAIPRGHKVAVVDMPVGTVALKYGQPIGIVSSPIRAGDHVHLHNLAMRESGASHDFCSNYRPVQAIPASERRHFLGYSRPYGRAGTRNYIAIISSVNCSATVSKNIADHFNHEAD